MEVKKQQSWSCPGALCRFLFLPSKGLNIKKVPGFVLHAFCCVPVISFSTEKAFSIGGKKKSKKKKNKAGKPTPHIFGNGLFF